MNNKKKQVKRIFDTIAVNYDFLNHLLSAGVDFYWRKKALKLTKLTPDSILLDVACGTGDFSICAKKLGVMNIFGVDFSLNMLKLFRQKSEWIKGRNVQLVAEELPFKNESVTNITAAFGVRNFYDIKQAFNSFHRILKADGKVTVLEFRLPENGLIKSLYIFYFKNILPFVGGLISKDKAAYSYLPASVEEFDEKIDLENIFKESGFSRIVSYSLTFGIVQIVIAQK